MFSVELHFSVLRNHKFVDILNEYNNTFSSSSSSGSSGGFGGSGFGSASGSGYIYFVDTGELQWLEHLWNHENMFETGVVRVNEC